MPKPFDFAPITGQLPSRVRFAAAWLRLNAFVTLGLLLLAMALALAGDAEMRGVLLDSTLSVIASVVSSFGLLIAARGLSNGTRWGGYAGVAAFLLPVAVGLIGGTLLMMSIIVCLVGVVAILSAWSRLE